MEKRREGYGWEKQMDKGEGKGGGLWVGKWRSIKGLKKRRVMDGKKKGELWVGKGGWISVGKRSRDMSEKNGDGYEWEKG
jgi:hypothetical protein